MNSMLAIDLERIYKREQICEFELGRFKTEKILVGIEIRELSAKGFIRLATKENVRWNMPPKFPGKPLSEYVKEIKG